MHALRHNDYGIYKEKYKEAASNQFKTIAHRLSFILD